jgi:type IV pilus assembly protein PilA
MTHIHDRLVTDERGLTLIELLVTILIIGILAAVALPAFLSQKSKAYDSSAKTMAQTAETAAETYATEHSGEYSFKAPKELKTVEPAINESSSGTEPYLTLAKGKGTGDDEYEVTVKAYNTGDEFTIKRSSSGSITRECASKTKGCPGQTNSSSSW